MGRSCWVVALTMVVGLVPGAAQANRVKDLELSMTEREVVIQVAAEQPLLEPRVKIARGKVKAWFPDVDEDTRLEVRGDGAAIERLRLRPGASGTALLHVDLGDRRMLASDDVRVQVHRGGAMLRIERSALAPVRPHRPHPDARRSKTRKVLTPSAQASGAPRSDAAEVGEGVTLKAAQKGAKKGAQEVVEPASGEPGKAAATKPKKTDSLLPLSSVSAATMGEAAPAKESANDNLVGLMVGVTALLALVYAFVRRWSARKTGQGPLANIEVIGTRRLGGRHQLVLVRALGEDHLLSMNGEHTERISSAPSPGTQAMSLKLLAPPKRSAPASLARALEESSEPDDDTLDSEPEKPKDAPFGAELLGFMQKRADPTWVRARRALRNQAASPAVAGLLRLRDRAAN